MGVSFRHSAGFGKRMKYEIFVFDIGLPVTDLKDHVRVQFSVFDNTIPQDRAEGPAQDRNGTGNEIFVPAQMHLPVFQHAQGLFHVPCVDLTVLIQFNVAPHPVEQLHPQDCSSQAIFLLRVDCEILKRSAVSVSF